MAVMISYAHGQFNWIDLLATDMRTAKSFYSGLFGWDVDDRTADGGPPYALFLRDGRPVCGLGEMNADLKAMGLPPMWNSYINVDDVDAAAKLAVELGGKITMPPMPVMDAGRMAGIQDPTGACVFLWQALQHKGAGLVNLPDTWVWNEVMTPDPAAAMTFYGDLFGWSFAKDENSPANYWMIDNRGRRNGGLMEMTKEEFGDMPACWSVYFHVSDASAAVGRLKELGGSLCRGPFDSSVGPIAVVADNQGAVFNLIQLSVPPDE